MLDIFRHDRFSLVVLYVMAFMHVAVHGILYYLHYSVVCRTCQLTLLRLIYKTRNRRVVSLLIIVVSILLVNDEY
jgi:hypothetical protein